MRRAWLVALSRWHRYGTGRRIGCEKASLSVAGLDFWADGMDMAMGSGAAGPPRVPNPPGSDGVQAGGPDYPAMPQSQPMTTQPSDLSPDDWRRIVDALRYLGRDLHHRSFAVSDDRRRLLWQEMDQCLALAERLQLHAGDEPVPPQD